MCDARDRLLQCNRLFAHPPPARTTHTERVQFGSSQAAAKCQKLWENEIKFGPFQTSLLFLPAHVLPRTILWLFHV